MRDVFSLVDVQRILQIPLNVHGIEEFVAWNYTRPGTFSVCLAYLREFEHMYGLRLVRADGQGNAQVNPVWKNNWYLRIPGKIKQLLTNSRRPTYPMHTPMSCLFDWIGAVAELQWKRSELQVMGGLGSKA